MNIERRLEDYPVLDESDWSDREHQEFLESWNNWAARDFECALRPMLTSPRALMTLEDASKDALMELWRNEGQGEYSEDHVDIDHPAERISRAAMAKFLRKLH